jgi:hypothetical protein
MQEPKKHFCFRKSTWLWIGGAIAILFLVAYPKPSLFLRTVSRAIQPPIDPDTVAEISAGLPDDPAQIEGWVIEHIERDANDYANWGVIFYIASPAEVLSIGRGPCYGRAIVLASILEEKGIPYRLFMMPGHVWVDFAERKPPIWPEFEKPEYAVWRWENGRWHWNGFGWLSILPRMMLIQAQLYWRITPLIGKMVVLMIIIGGIWLRWWNRRGKMLAELED